MTFYEPPFCVRHKNKQTSKQDSKGIGHDPATLLTIPLLDAGKYT